MDNQTSAAIFFSTPLAYDIIRKRISVLSEILDTVWVIIVVVMVLLA